MNFCFTILFFFFEVLCVFVCVCTLNLFYLIAEAPESDTAETKLLGSLSLEGQKQKKNSTFPTMKTSKTLPLKKTQNKTKLNIARQRNKTLNRKANYKSTEENVTNKKKLT